MTDRVESEEKTTQLRYTVLEKATSAPQIPQGAEQEIHRTKEVLERSTRELSQGLMTMRATLESTSVAIVVTDEKGKVTLFNEKYIDMWKIPREVLERGMASEVRELASLNFADPHRYIARSEEIEVARQESLDLLELKDGRILERYSQVLTVEGQGRGRVWSFQDVTRRQLAEITSGRLAAIVASSDDAIIGKDLNGIITSWNSGAEHIFGYTAEEMIGASVMRLIPPDSQQEEREILSRIRRGERVDHFETVRLTKDGRKLDGSVTVSPIKDSAGQVVGASKVVRDITEQKRTEQELARAKEAAEAANRAKGRFLANMSHELRTPLSAILGYSEILQEEAVERQLVGEYGADLEKINSAGKHLLVLINDILDFSRIEAGTLSFELLDFELIETVQSALELLVESAHGKGIELASAMAPDLPTQLRGDPERLQQILANLIGNALKFTEKGEVLVRVSKESETKTHARIHFRVEDSGIGISAEAQGKLFQAFNQADGSTTRKYGGTGLGLALAQRLVTEMGGEMGVRSETGKGSTFWFTVRLLKQTGKA